MERAKDVAEAFMVGWCPAQFDHQIAVSPKFITREARPQDGATWHVTIYHMHLRTDDKGPQESRRFTCDVKDGSAPQDPKCEKYPNQPSTGKTRNDEQHINDVKDEATISF
jgi:hypothetical protein